MTVTAIKQKELGNKTKIIAYDISREDIENVNKNLSFINKEQLEIIKDSIKRKELNAKIGNTLFVPALSKDSKALLLFGIGKKDEDFSALEMKTLGASIVRKSKTLGFKSIAFSPRNIKERISNKENQRSFFETNPNTSPIKSIVEGMLFADYNFSLLKTDPNQKEDKEKKVENIYIVTNENTGAKSIKEGNSIGIGINIARQLIDRPANHCTPTFLAGEAEKLEKEKYITVSVLGKKEIEKLNMKSFLSVAQGSSEEPKLIVIEYKPDNIKHKDKIALVGKGITFDTGGISLKPAKNMHYMKADMSGAASVIGAMYAIANIGLEREVLGIIPSCENMPGSRATKPGDVVSAMNGKTIEILNTDAEGRLVLADALAYSSSVKNASHIIDIATLTGACVVALGEAITGLMTNNKDFGMKLIEAGKESGESIWPLPMFKEYYEQMKSDVADIANIGGPYAGTITGAIFLENFIDEKPWIHLDIAGPSWASTKDAYYTKGATGSMVSSLVKLLRQ